MRNLKLTIPVIAILLTFAFSAYAKSGPQAFLQSIDKKIKPLLSDTKRNKARILKIVGQMLNFDKLCKDSLGTHWAERTPAEQEDFSKTLRALIEKNIVKRLKKTKENLITYESETVNGNSAKVVTIVKDGKGPRAAEIEIAYIMIKKGNKWMVVDMKTDGVSLVSNYRSQFNKLIKKDGWDAMMKKMKDKLAE
jgi:phospholipid transport system substrate-binding protein